ncbi:hypothetical protein CRG98_037614 [Punica granatum]|uniref:Uncharacterized protein n=1 Tax=Punica granatum TaxID=22663 RepID=A0A2I0IF62_PUNGR|nr:hypothetical protein CRG98_037614 [Punica granatum]
MRWLMENALLKESVFARGTGACSATCVMHGRLPSGLLYARAHFPMDCEVHERLPGEFVICTGALPCGLRGVRALVQRVLQYARAHCPVDCGVHGHLLGLICNMHGRIVLWIAGCTGACLANCIA